MTLSIILYHRIKAIKPLPDNELCTCSNSKHLQQDKTFVAKVPSTLLGSPQDLRCRFDPWLGQSLQELMIINLFPTMFSKGVYSHGH